MSKPTIETVAQSAGDAAKRISGLIRQTPFDRSAGLSSQLSADVFLKLENLQHTGSFKLRGAANRLLTLTEEQQAAGCVTASSGNHGAAVAFAMQKLGIDGVIFVPEHTSPAKLDAIRSFGGKAELFGTDGLDTELHAREYASDRGMFYVSPYIQDATTYSFRCGRRRRPGIRGRECAEDGQAGRAHHRLPTQRVRGHGSLGGGGTYSR